MRRIILGLCAAAVLTGCAAPVTAAKNDPSTTSVDAPETTTTQSDLEAMTDWVNGGGLDSLIAVNEALTLAGEAADTGNVGLLDRACANLADAVSDARRTLPVPDADVDYHYSAALDAYADAAGACLRGDYDSSADHLARGVDHTEAATAAIQAYTE